MSNSWDSYYKSFEPVEGGWDIEHSLNIEIPSEFKQYLINLGYAQTDADKIEVGFYKQIGNTLFIQHRIPCDWCFRNDFHSKAFKLLSIKEDWISLYTFDD